MDTKALPTTTLAVHDDLMSRADFRGIEEHDRSGRAHYLLGMCEALLADANREILKLQLQRAQKRVGR
jgi:hypothetical protein